MADVDVTNLRLPRTWVTAQPDNPAFDISTNELDDDIRALGDLNWGNNAMLNISTLEINNPAATFQYTITGSAIIADRVMTLPLLTAGDTFVFEAFAATLTNKTLNLTSNTLSGTTAQFNTALSDDDFATLTNTVTLTNKTLTLPTIGDFTNATHSHLNAAGGGTITKASISDTPWAKADLPAVTVYTDQANTFGVFAQRFPTTQLQLDNPAATFQYILATSAIVADRTVTLPLLTGNDNFVFEAFAQPLTNKTIDADLSTITNIGDAEVKNDLITGQTQVTPHSRQTVQLRL